MKDCTRCRYHRPAFRECGAGVGRPPTNADRFFCSKFRMLSSDKAFVTVLVVVLSTLVFGLALRW